MAEDCRGEICDTFLYTLLRPRGEVPSNQLRGVHLAGTLRDRVVEMVKALGTGKTAAILECTSSKISHIIAGKQKLTIEEILVLIANSEFREPYVLHGELPKQKTDGLHRMLHLREAEEKNEGVGGESFLESVELAVERGILRAFAKMIDGVKKEG